MSTIMVILYFIIIISVLIFLYIDVIKDWTIKIFIETLSKLLESMEKKKIGKKDSAYLFIKNVITMLENFRKLKKEE